MASRRSADPPPPISPAPGAQAAPRAKLHRKRAAPADAAALSAQARHELIAVGAYLRAERRGFAPGHAGEDWLAAEAEVDALLTESPGASQ